jgi:GR25 family glycosyltransferase involved in LPS biosynthesis
MDQDKSLGCNKSHLHILQKINEDFLKTGINKINYIFEDDVTLINQGISIKDHRRLLNQFVKRYLQKGIVLFAGFCYENNNTIIDTLKFNEFNFDVYKLTTPRCLHSYIISSDTAQKLLKLSSEYINVLPKGYEKYYKNNYQPLDEVIGRSIFNNHLTAYGMRLFKQPWFDDTPNTS